MSKRDIYILMYKDYEVLSFYVNFKKSRTYFLNKLAHFDKAPYGFDEDDDDIDRKLFRFFNARAIPNQRKGYKEILKATHCRNSFLLSFKGHGLSLSNHYWFKKPKEKLRYADINFFTNRWDDSFARLVLKEDYQGLANVDLNVPDIVTSGWGTKGWIFDPKKGPRLFKMGINDDCPDEVLGEVLASSLARKLFKKEEVLQYDLEKIYGKYASVSSPIINIDEELTPLSSYLPLELYNIYHSINSDKNKRKDFLNKLKETNNYDVYSFFCKLLCLKSLCFVNDLHFDNISVVKNMKTGQIKMAPIYDLGGSFGSGKTSKQHLINPSKATLLLIYFVYGNLDPDWDYSWYDANRLIGFEEEIRKTLSISSFYKPETIDFVINVYRNQKNTLDEMASKK